MRRNYFLGISGLLWLVGPTMAQDLDSLVERGRELFNAPVGCATCHAATGEGLVGPSLLFGPTPVDIFDQLESNPVMGVIVAELDPSDEDLAAISMYIRTLAGMSLDAALPGQWLAALASARANQSSSLEFAKTPRDLQVEAVESFADLAANWTRRAKQGSVLSHYQTQVVATFDPGKPKFTPEPGKTYFYENVGTTSSPSVLFEGYTPPESNQIVVGDAQTHEVIASYMLPLSLRAVVHTSAMSPDGRYVYIIGARPGGDIDTTSNLQTSATLIKADALTLQPIKQIAVGGRLHHGQVFRNYVMIDYFARDPDGLAFALLDPETDEIVGGVKDVDLGGYVYTVWSDKDYDYI